MKIRSDFVTNSSSSAFVVVGAKITKEEDWEKLYKLSFDRNIRLFGEEKIAGKVIAKLDFDSYVSITKSYSSLEAIFIEVEDILAELDIDEEVYLIADVFST